MTEGVDASLNLRHDERETPSGGFYWLVMVRSYWS